MHYVYPYPHVDRIIPLMAEGTITPYLDIPFQHASPSVLKAMRRPAKQEKVLERIASWRRDVPELAIRSTFIVGFPGETEEDFQILLDFITEAEIDRAGCFKYENVVHATSRDLPGHVPEAVKEDRWHRFMARQADVSASRLANKVGRPLDVIVDGWDADAGLFAGRSQADAPEVDGIVRIHTDADLEPGDIIPVQITASDAYDLDGTFTAPPPGEDGH